MPMTWRAALCAGVLLGLTPPSAGATGLDPLAPHWHVGGADVENVEMRALRGAWRTIAWDEFEHAQLDPGPYEVRLRVESPNGDAALELPWCAGRARVALDGHDVRTTAGPVVLPLGAGAHEVVLALVVSAYEGRIACGDRPRLGTAALTHDGLDVLEFPSPNASKGGGRAVVYVPPAHDGSRAAPLLVGVPPWNGSLWTYAAYAPLLREARARDVLLLMPSSLGNSLYTAAAEDETMRAIDALSAVLSVDPRGVSIWGASMGGAGATTIAFHRPDRFATVTSFFGDSKYDLATYARAILPSEAAAHFVNALDVVDNARHPPLHLVHGEDDRTSPIRQSEILARAMRDRGFSVRFDRVPGAGHSGALVARFLPDVVATAAMTRAEASPSRVTYRSVRAEDTGAYGVRLLRSSTHGDAFVDVERAADAVHVRRAEAVREIVLARGALGTNRDTPPRIIDDTDSVSARWEAPP
jgi:pimeloyl-ACP methyl ester carboxylesterase